jgi:hypothetical protein
LANIRKFEAPNAINTQCTQGSHFGFEDSSIVRRLLMPFALRKILLAVAQTTARSREVKLFAQPAWLENDTLMPHMHAIKITDG